MKHGSIDGSVDLALGGPVTGSGERTEARKRKQQGVDRWIL